MSAISNLARALRGSTALIPAVLLAWGAGAPAQGQIWQGPGSDFHTGANWVGGSVPGTGGTPEFAGGSATTVTTSAAVTVAGLSFSGPVSYSLIFNGNGTIAGDVTNTSGIGQGVTVAAGSNLSLGGASGQSVTYNVLGTLEYAGSSAGGLSAIDVSGQVSLASSAGTFVLGSLAGGATGVVSTASDGTTTLQIGGLNTSTTFAGTFLSTGGDLLLDKVGSGTLTLTGNAGLAGVTISAGTLQIGNGGATGTFGSGAVVNNAALVINRNTIDVTNDISGSGSVTIEGSATLSGTNTYAGGTTVNGFLSVAADSALGAATGGLTFNTGFLTSTASFSSSRAITLGTGGGALEPEAGTILTLAGVISGTGELRKNGLGTLVLTGTNDYTGATAFNAGITQIAAASALGNGTQIYVNGGTLRTTADVALDRAVALQSLGGSFSPDAGTTLTLSGAISGEDNALVMQGAGTLVLTGANSYGATTISAGTLQIGAGGTTGTLGSGAVANNAALVFNRTDTMTVSNVISGTGTVTQAGSGTTILTGDNTYAGGTTISAGTLQVGDGGTTGRLGTGAVVNDGTLVFQRDGQPTFTNNISGTGSVRIERTTTLSGANSYTGGTITRASSMSPRTAPWATRRVA